MPVRSISDTIKSFQKFKVQIANVFFFNGKKLDFLGHEMYRVFLVKFQILRNRPLLHFRQTTYNVFKIITYSSETRNIVELWVM